MTEKRPNQYIVRVWTHTTASQSGGIVEFRPWAFSAEDARLQMDLELSKYDPRRGHITYIGPVNPDCTCLNECRCGVLAP